ncbi:MAG: hypothetical protein RIS79_3850 [Verrucomicrobiota bacterium]|jgi:hypothetical protein
MLTFAWKIRDRSTLHVVLLTILLAVLMALFFVVFRITYPSVQTADAVPQRMLMLDPADPEALALIHRAQDKSFGLVPAEPVDLTAQGNFPSFTPGYAGFELQLRAMEPAMTTPEPPRVFTAATPVLPEVAPRAKQPVIEARPAVLRAIPGPELARRAPAALEIRDVPLSDPENARFSISVDASGRVTEALPLFNCEDPATTKALRDRVAALRFQPDSKTARQWGTLGFHWQSAP